jgi:hypothetical protein
MNRDEIRKEVIKKFHEEQQVPIRIELEGKRSYNCTTAKIVKFNPSTVLTEHNGYKESFTYWDFSRMTAPREIKQSAMYIPKNIINRKKPA